MIKALFFITIILTISVYGQQPDFEWAKFMGGDSCVELKDQDNQSMTVYRNPFHQAFTIEFNKTGN